MLEKRLTEAQHESDPARRDALTSDVAWAVRTLREASSDGSDVVSLPSGPAGMLQHLKELLDAASAENSDPEAVTRLQAALRAYVDEALGKFGEKGNDMAKQDEEESLTCSACGHVNDSDDMEESAFDNTDEPETDYYAAGIKRGNQWVNSVNRSATSRSDLGADDDAGDDMGETSELEAMKAASFADQHGKYAGEESRQLQRQQGISHHAARLALAKEDGFGRYRKEAGLHKRAQESLREAIRGARLRERVLFGISPSASPAVYRSV
jgi:hypothetical protein